MRTPSLWRAHRLPTPAHEIMSQFEEFINEFDPHQTPTLRGAGMDFYPAVDLEEKDGNYVVTVDLPGMKKDEIKIDLADNVLSISGEKTRKHEAEGGRYSERSYGKFMRTFTLPNTVDSEKINAQFEDGVLKVTLPKAEQARTRAIKIQ
jgi:Molecular chaperone (small heat shock protein)